MNRFIFIVCSLFVLSISVFGQSALEKDLSKSFREYGLVKLDNKITLEKAKAKQPIIIQAYGRYFEFVLTPNDIRADNYRAIESSSSGQREMRQSEVVTFKGILSNDISSEVRFTVTGENIEGFIYTSDNKKFFVTKAEKFSSHAHKSDAIVYGDDDLLQTVDLSNDTEKLPDDIQGKMDFGFDILNSYAGNSTDAFEMSKAKIAEMTASTTADLRTVEVATEADYQWVSQSGGTAVVANNEILGILNLVDGIYRRDLNLTIKVTYQHAWTTSDPYPTTSTSETLNAFLSYWNTNYPYSQYPRDTAHLFTGKYSAQGIAYQGATCGNPSYSYGLTARNGSLTHLITAHEIGHNLGAGHTDNAGSCANSLMNPTINFSATSFCDTTKSQISNYVALSGGCLSSAVTTNIASKTRFDFDGDSKADVSVFRPSTGAWYVSRSSDNSSYGNSFGLASDLITPADFDGDSKTDAAVFRPSNGTWYLQRSTAGFTSFQFGQLGDIPTPGDFDGDGKDDVAVFRPSTQTWFISRSTGGVTIQQFGINGDVPTIADYDGDKRADIAVYRPSLGQWWIQRSSLGTIVYQFGSSTDKPVQGDYTGDGRADVAFFRPSGEWFVLRSEDSSFYSFPFGTYDDIPSPGDYDGDGKSDAAVFRPSNSTWYAQRATAGTLIKTFGQSSDKSVPNAFIP